MNRSVSRSLVLVLSLTACSGPQIKAAYKSDVDATLAAQSPAQRELPRAALEPRAWKVGQWALYRTNTDGKPGYEKLSIVGEDECGFWLEQVQQDYYQRSISKICYSRMPWLPDDSGHYVADTLDLVQVMITQGNGGRLQIWDFRKNPQMKDSMKMLAQTLVTFDWVKKESLPREDLVVPAGRFDGTATFPFTLTVLWKTITVTTHIHPEVPVYGVVRTDASTGRISELLSFGESGAESVLQAPVN
jgi:hypothetical protein